MCDLGQMTLVSHGTAICKMGTLSTLQICCELNEIVCINVL